MMRRQSATNFVLLLWLIAAVSSVCYAQDKTPQNAALNKKACDFITKSDAESILGVTFQPPVSGAPFRSLLDNQDFIKGKIGEACEYTTYTPNQQPQQKIIFFSLEVRYSPTPNPRAVEDVRQQVAARTRHTPTDIADLGDAAFWIRQNGATLFVFSGGTMQLMIESEIGLEKVKALAIKALGGTGRTGYVYTAPAVAETKPSLAAPAPSPAPVPTPGKAGETKSATQMFAATGKTFSQAPYITQSQFLSQVKEVSVTYAVAPSFTKYVSAGEQQRYVANALAQYGMVVRPNAPVALLVTLDYHPSTITETTTYLRGPDKIEDYRSHHFFLSLKFFVRAAAWRNGKFHLLEAAPASESYFFSVHEDSEANKMVFGDKTIPHIKSSFANNLAECLKSIASDTRVDSTTWPANSWSEKQKSAADAEFAKIMRSHSAVDKRLIEGIDKVQLELEPNVKNEACEIDPSWGKFWNAEIQRLGWVNTPRDAPVMLEHMFWCLEQQQFECCGPYYVWILDIAYLKESNVVFELNGGWVRKRAVLFSSHRMATPLYKQLSATMQGYIPRSIMEFSADLTLGKPTMPAVANPATSPGKSAEPVRPAPVPPPAEGFGDLIGPGGFVRPPAGYDK